MAQQTMQRRQSMAQRFADQLLVYPGAGHLIGIPFQFAKAEMAHSFLDVGAQLKLTKRPTNNHGRSSCNSCTTGKFVFHTLS
jgi:hypothetical protein